MATLTKFLTTMVCIQSSEEAVKVWSAHFREVLQGSKEPLVGSLDIVFEVRHLRVSRAVIIQSWKVKLLKKR